MEFPGYFVNTTSESPTTTEEPTPEVVRNDMKFLIVPLIVVVAIMILSALVNCFGFHLFECIFIFVVVRRCI